MTPTILGWSLLSLYALALAAGILLGLWSRHTPYTPPEVPPTEERPALPPTFRPVKPRAVKDRLAWRKVHPREAEAIARQARQLHFHEQEEAELRAEVRHG